LNTCHLHTLYLCEQGCEDPWLFFEAKVDPRAKKFGKHWRICIEKHWVNALAVPAVQGWLTCWNMLGVQCNVTALHIIVKLQHATSTRHI